MELGDPIARGRDADVYRLDGGRVLRRYRRPGPTDREWLVMAYARAHGDRLVHLDLHPANVLLTASGPAVIDWPNAGRGDGLADVATTWVVLRTSRVDGPLGHRLVAAAGQRLFAAAFLAASTAVRSSGTSRW